MYTNDVKAVQIGVYDFKKAFSNLFIVAVHYTTNALLLLLLSVAMYTTQFTTKNQNIPYLVAIVDCTMLGQL